MFYSTQLQPNQQADNNIEQLRDILLQQDIESHNCSKNNYAESYVFIIIK